jgi:UDP-N-acetylmuramoyl-L-alanyl-D-glutamate--2,6-diaminopimelate ligase
MAQFRDTSPAARPPVALVDSPAVDLERVIAALAPAEVVGGARVEVEDLVYDARRAGAGALFFCVPGERADGHAFAREAVERGAVALVVERALPLDVPQLVVLDTRRAMAAAADVFFGEPTRELVVAGVTGTSGKTTTSYLLHAMLEAAGLQPGLLGTVESRVGDRRLPAERTTAEAIDLQRTFREMLDAGHASCAMEATSHGSELRRLDCVRFSALVFTNLGRDHLDFHGTLERYYEAKRRLFVEGRPPAAVNVGDEHGRRLAGELRSLGQAPLLTFGFADEADVRPDGLELSRSGARLTAAGLELRTPLLGRFNVENVLGAVAAARLLDLPDAAIQDGVSAVAGVPGRFEPVDEGQPFAVVVDYAHKPDALDNVLRTARDVAEHRVICVFGCGGDRDRGKRPEMGRIASELSDVAIVTSDNPRSEEPEAIVREILEGVTGPVEVQVDRRTAISRAIEQARPGDVVVIAGRGHEREQEVAGRRLPFDDREVARTALRRQRATA